MKKNILILIILTLILTIGCTQNDLENYRAAMDKTDNMIKGSSLMEIETSTNYNLGGIDEELIKMLKTFEDTKIIVKSYFDKDIKRSKDEGYLVLGELGYDFNVYGVNEKYYIEPLFFNLKDKKYIELNISEMINSNQNSEDLFKSFGIKWSEIINEKNVMKGDKVLITTDDGEVKSREFTIELNDEQLKELLLFFIDKFEENDEYMELLEEGIYYSNEEQLTDVESKEMYANVFEELKNFIKKAKNMSLFYKAYIDIDGYVVQEDIKFNYENVSANSGTLENIEFKMVNQYTNIEKEQDLDFNEPTEEESIILDDMDFENFVMPQQGGK